MPHPTPPHPTHVYMHITAHTETGPLTLQVHMNVNRCPTPPHPTHVYMHITAHTETGPLTLQVHMNVNTCPTPPHPTPPNVHENTRPDKGRAPTNKQPIGIAGYCIRHCFFFGPSYLVVPTSFPMFVDCSLLFCLLVCSLLLLVTLNYTLLSPHSWLFPS